MRHCVGVWTKLLDQGMHPRLHFDHGDTDDDPRVSFSYSLLQLGDRDEPVQWYILES
eukprot:c15246_g1_i1 orf=141-311(+)